MKATFSDTVDILVKAYLNGTLEHRKCTACAVGNIVAARMGTLPAKTTSWEYSMKSGHGQYDCNDYENGEVASWYALGGVMPGEQQELTGYSVEELTYIEAAFEGDPCDTRHWNDDSRMYEGLMRVVSVLAQIHGVDMETTQKARHQFVKI